jgi:hypothetical protein
MTAGAQHSQSPINAMGRCGDDEYVTPVHVGKSTYETLIVTDCQAETKRRDTLLQASWRHPHARPQPIHYDLINFSGCARRYHGWRWLMFEEKRETVMAIEAAVLPLMA